MSITYQINGYLNNFGLCIKKKKIDDQIYDILTKYFNVKPKLKDIDEKDIKGFDVYYEDDKYIVLPKFSNNLIIYINKYIEKEKYLLINDTKYNKISFNITKCKYKNIKVKFNFKGKLRDYQQTIIDEIMNKFNISDLPKGGLIKLSCGGGKTVLAIFLSHFLGLKTLIIVHKEFLMDQWIERIQQYTDAKIGIIRQNKVDIENKDIVIGMLRSISTKDYDNDIFNQFGLVIYDEVHHLGSRVDSQALLKTSSEYTIGLSATPERSDGLLKVINWHIGDILYEMEKKYSYRVLVKKIFFTSNNILFKEKKRWYNGRMAPCNNKMFDNITKINTRNDLIINFINSLKNFGRKILILSYRVDHLECLKNLIDKIIIDNDEAHIYNSYYYMGKTKKGEKKLAEKDGDIIFATMQLAEEGLDISHLDTIIFALPVSIQKEKNKIKSDKTLIQSIGRILRNDKLENLTQIPLVIDISDMFSIYKTWSSKRNEVYNKKKWFIQNYYWDDSNYIYNTNDDKTKKPMDIILNDIIDEDFIEKNLILTENDNIEKIESDSEKDSDDNTYTFGLKK
jgi:superfamily II DNA or RNA helicase